MESMEERVSGFTVRGSWTDIVEHGERITEALKDAGVSGDAFEEWEEWRPKAHERLDEEMSAKTSEQASVDEGAGEEAEVSAGEDLQSAGEKLQAASDRLRDEESGAAIDRIQESVDHAKRAADTAGRRAIRSVQDAVYRNVMTVVAPQYFNNELVSATIRRAGGFEDDEFALEVNVNDDDLKEEIGDTLAEYEAEVDRWHIDVEKDTSNLEAAENAEISG